MLSVMDYGCISEPLPFMATSQTAMLASLPASESMHTTASASTLLGLGQSLGEDQNKAGTGP